MSAPDGSAAERRPGGVLGRVVGTSRGLVFVSAVLVTLMMVHISADVAGKYFFNAPIHGTLEIVALYYMVAVVYLPLAWGSHDGDQIKVELFTRRLPAGYLRRHDGVVDLVFAAFLALITWQGVVDALAKMAMNESRETAIDLLIVWPSRWLVPIGFAITTAYHLLRGVMRLAGRV
ncbi:MAG: TRAP transporter small permease [Rhodospirillales bacterium]